MAKRFYFTPKRPRKIAYIGVLLRPYRPRECSFRELDSAIEWCLTNSLKTGYSAEVVHGINSGGKVVWKHKGTLPKKSEERKPPSGQPEDERRWNSVVATYES